MNSALDLYNGYCHSLGYTEPPVTKTLTLTDAGSTTSESPDAVTDAPEGPVTVTATATVPGGGPEIVATETLYVTYATAPAQNVASRLTLIRGALLLVSLSVFALFLHLCSVTNFSRSSSVPLSRTC